MTNMNRITRKSPLEQRKDALRPGTVTLEDSGQEDVDSMADDVPVVDQTSDTCGDGCECCGPAEGEAPQNAAAHKPGASCGPACLEAGTCTCE